MAKPAVSLSPEDVQCCVVLVTSVEGMPNLAARRRGQREARAVQRCNGSPRAGRRSGPGEGKAAPDGSPDGVGARAETRGLSLTIRK